MAAVNYFYVIGCRVDEDIKVMVEQFQLRDGFFDVHGFDCKLLDLCNLGRNVLFHACDVNVIVVLNDGLFTAFIGKFLFVFDNLAFEFGQSGVDVVVHGVAFYLGAELLMIVIY